MIKKEGIRKLKKGLTLARWSLQDLASRLGWAFSAKNYLSYDYYTELKERELQREERERLRYLKQRKWIEMKKTAGRLSVRLTAAGWQAALRDRIKMTKKRCPGGICLIIFDVPERERHIRNTLRHFLKECHFTQLQKSVWMTEYNVIEPLCLLLQTRRLHQWIRIIIGKPMPRPGTSQFFSFMKTYHRRY